MPFRFVSLRIHFRPFYLENDTPRSGIRTTRNTEVDEVPTFISL